MGQLGGVSYGWGGVSVQTGFGDALSHPIAINISVLRSDIAPCENDRATVSLKAVKSKNGQTNSVSRFGGAGGFVTKRAGFNLRPCVMQQIT